MHYIKPNDYEDYFVRSVRMKYFAGIDYENADKDEDPCIRMKYYDRKGYTKEALKDKHHAIRFNAYNKFGWKLALDDPEFYIKEYALQQTNPVHSAFKKGRR